MKYKYEVRIANDGRWLATFRTREEAEDYTPSAYIANKMLSGSYSADSLEVIRVSVGEKKKPAKRRLV